MRAIEDEVVTPVDDFFETPSIVVPPTPPDAHKGKITTVTLKRLNNDKQTAVIVVGLTSYNVPTLENLSLDIFVPKLWEQNIDQGKDFDPATLPNEEGNKQQMSYRMGIANSDQTATMQRLYKIARDAGQDPVTLGLKRRPETIEEYVENYNQLLSGLEVIFVRREKGGDDPAFSHQLQVKDVLAADEDIKNPKRFRKYVKAWEQEEV